MSSHLPTLGLLSLALLLAACPRSDDAELPEDAAGSGSGSGSGSGDAGMLGEPDAGSPDGAIEFTGAGHLVDAFGAGGRVQSFAPGTLMAMTHAGDALFVVGNTGDPDAAWRVEKRDAISGDLDAAFGVGGVIEVQAGNGFDGAAAVAVAGGALYVAGSETAPGGGPRWRVEKRDVGTGALDALFGDGGVLHIAHGNGAASATAIAVDATAVFIGGDRQVNLGEAVKTFGLVEKRDRATGAPVTGFGVGGVLDLSLRPVVALALVGGDVFVTGEVSFGWGLARFDAATGAAPAGFGVGGTISSSFVMPGASETSNVSGLALAGDSVLLAGQQLVSSTVNYGWRVERRQLVAGELVAGFGAGGVVRVDPSPGWDLPPVIIADSADDAFYLAGAVGAGENVGWRLEKRGLSDGASRAEFGAGGAFEVWPPGFAGAPVAAFVAGDALYVAGAGWVIEKRSLVE